MSGTLSTAVDPINNFARRVPTWVVYILCLMPIPFVFYQAITGALGPEPINPLERQMGELALQFLIAGLLITPFRKYLGLNLLKFRRTMGVLAFTYAAVHLGVWVLLDMSLRWEQMWSDIWKRPYITIGMVGFIAMIPLAVTSNNLSIRKMEGEAWCRMHKLVNPIAVLRGVDYIMLQKARGVESVVFLLIIIAFSSARCILIKNTSGVNSGG